jgi:hypothetical protein
LVLALEVQDLIPEAGKRYQKYQRMSNPDTQVYLSFGGGLRLFSEDYFIKELEPLGMTRRGFRSLCRSLKVPLVHIGTTAMVDITSFQLAMKAVCRVGQEDFYVPGCEPLRKNVKRGAKELDMEYFDRQWETVLADLIAARKMHGLTTPQDTVDQAKKAAKRLTDMALHVSASDFQEQYEAKAREILEKELDS